VPSGERSTKQLIETPQFAAEELTRSELERRFLSLCRRHRLPTPEVNARVGRYEVDFLWRRQGVVVETDGFEFHRDRAAFEADRARDAELQLLGLRVLRFTYRAVRDEAGKVAATLRRVLAPGSK
jgi:very-short-patch-repair endonuclease